MNIQLSSVDDFTEDGFTKAYADISDFSFATDDILSNLDFMIAKLEDMKSSLTIDKVLACITDPKAKQKAKSMTSIFIIDSAKIVYDKYINLLKDAYNKVVKQLQLALDDFKKLEIKYNFLRDSGQTGAARGRTVAEIKKHLKSMNEKITKPIKISNYDVYSVCADPAAKANKLKPLIEDHLNSLFINLEDYLAEA